MFTRFLLLACLFSSLIFAQDFLPSVFWCATPQTPDPGDEYQRGFMYSPDYVEFSSEIRERMMPYYVKELKMQGVSKETHTQGKKTTAIFYYNEKGLLTKYESKEYFKEIIPEYDANNNIVALVSKSDGYYSRVVVTRDSLRRISEVNTEQCGYIYTYDISGKLVSISSKTPRLTVIWRKDNLFVTHGISFAINADSIEFDEYGRLLTLKYGMDANGGSAEYDKSGRLISEGYFARSILDNIDYTFKNNLVIKKLHENFNNVTQKTTKTVTNVKYEYKHKKKK